MAGMKLTPRARAVARYLLGGWKPESIAQQLGIQHASVKDHYCAEIRSATGKGSITAAVLSILRDPEAIEYVMEVRQ
jgi:DNA-binding NarL/FixJ family response regulator